MIFSDLQNAVVERLLWDAWFTEPGKTVGVFAEHKLDLAAQWQQTIGKIGAAVLVRTVGCAPTERVDLADVDVWIEMTEFVSINRGKSGSQKPGCDVGAKAMALLRGWTPDNNMWAPFLLWGQGLQYVGEDDQGLDRWVLQFRTQTMLELLAQVIGTDTAAIVDDQGRAFVVSPTPA